MEVVQSTPLMAMANGGQATTPNGGTSSSSQSSSAVTALRAASGAGAGPFQREIREWQHVDPNTGALLTGRLEADRWVNGPLNSFGKMVTQNMSSPDGSTQHTQKKQMEILQARTASGSLQVVRAQTVQTTSSRWSSSTLHSEISSSSSNSDSRHKTSALNGYSNHHPSSGFSRLHHQEQFLHRPPVSAARLLNLAAASSASISSSSNNNNFLHSSSGSPLTTNHPSSSAAHSLLANTTTSLSSSSSLSSANNGSSTGLLLNGHNHHHHHTSFGSNSFSKSSTISSSSSSSGPVVQIADSVGGLTAASHHNHLLNRSPHDSSSSSSWFDKFKDISVKEKPADADSFLSRGKSISIEDLSTERDEANFDDDVVEPTQWKRVSKIRRSLQFPRKTAPKSSTRPADLPENSGSVWKIRQELENGRRLNTAMRNNHIDFVALDNILKSVSDTPSPTTTKQQQQSDNTPRSPSGKSTTSTFLTAESLKEIRGKLRRLSNESLYRDDMSPGDERKAMEDDDAVTITEVETRMGQLQTSSSSDSYKSNSLESNRKPSITESISDDWHSRRKSYGFERMNHSSNFMSKMDSSTDSGIGRSTDLSSSWSSGGADASQGNTRGTIVTLGDQKEKPTNTAMVIKITNESREKEREQREEDIKRHSIAVDETSYVRDSLKTMFEKKSSVSVNGFSHTFIEELNKNKKKVEFCKTEVHFTADSGRVNIVETDEKPPPTNNFRRRRRSSGGSVGSSYMQAITSGAPVTHFGDLEQEVSETDLKENPVYTAPPVVTTSIGRPEPSPRRSIVTSDESDNQSADDISLRGILKNKPVKPKPYVLGENMANSESLWGVKLRPVSTELNYWHEQEELSGKSQTAVTTEDKSDSVSPATSFSTKINLTSVAPISKKSDESSIDPKGTTKILIDMSTTNSVNQNPLKSTSLIMRTMRSANQFDEAMKSLEATRRESIDSNEASEERRSAFHLISSSSIAKSSSASSIYNNKETPKLKVAKYAASLDGDVDDYPPTRYRAPMPALRRSFTNESRLSDFEAFITKNSSSSIRRSSTDEFPSVGMVSSVSACKPVAAPRLKKLGGSSVLSHQLTQLKRLYDAAEQYDSDESAKADEEVKLYLGNLTSEERITSELSGSWSRLKAKRNIQKYRDQDLKITVNSVSEFEIVKPSSNGTTTTTINTEGPPRSTNIMSIALKSPILSKKNPSPSTVNPPQSHESQPNQTQQPLSTHFKRHIPSNASSDTNGTARNEERASLRLSSGARQLRDHELSFFGVNPNNNSGNGNKQHSSGETKPTFTRSTTLTSSFIKRNSINMNPLSTSSSTNSVKSSAVNVQQSKTTQNSTQWQLSNDKPDLLRHSQRIDQAAASFSSTTQNTSKTTNAQYEPQYENLVKAAVAEPSQPVQTYDRKKDLKRDEQILEELTRAADEILNVVNNMSNAESTESLLNEFRGSKTSSTLGTIRECSASSKVMKSRGVQVSKNFDDSLKRHQRSGRVSSASSNESLSRSSPARMTTAISTSQAQESRNGISRRKLPNSSTESRRLIRMCSKERLHQSNASSSEDLPNAAPVEPPRRPRRTRYHNGEKDKESPRANASRSSTIESRRSDERTPSSRSHRSERSSTRTSKGHSTSAGLSSSSVIPTTAPVIDQQHRSIRTSSSSKATGPSVMTTTASSRSSSSCTPFPIKPSQHSLLIV
ncbi:serine-rich adhesin for platelets-like isoform X2 [Uranotaenia lowii]|uniref:serine-rich adhesin for platelets-like isoform X2 n=1 Tax=Uranotaenia lowii TaxID=190385 RepID=UPI002479A4F4|nr:serine-rich adhesin for platelets-like isoform X2 [Uranotaenia lowii]